MKSAVEEHDERAFAEWLQEALTYLRFERDDMSLRDLVEALQNGYHKVRQRTQRQLEIQLADTMCELAAAKEKVEELDRLRASVAEMQPEMGKMKDEADRLRA